MQGPRVGRDALLLNVGASAQLTSTDGIFSYYSSERGRKNYNMHSISAGFRLSFKQLREFSVARRCGGNARISCREITAAS